MRLIKSLFLLALFCLNHPFTTSQTTNVNSANAQEVLRRLEEGGEQFSLELFARISAAVSRQSYNFMISPFSIWSLIALTAEGASGNTLEQIRRTLRIESDINGFREGYKQIQRALNVNTSTVQVSVFQALFADASKPIYEEYKNSIQGNYMANFIPTDFAKSDEAKNTINNFVSKSTNGLISYIVNKKDVEQAFMILVSAIFFKGQWKHPFNSSLTREEPFYDESEKIMGNVNMMTITHDFPYAAMTAVDSYVLELPYGKEDRLSMLLFLPKKGASVTSVIEKISRVGIKRIYTNLTRNFYDFGEEEVEVLLPRFTITSDFILNVILEQMGITDLFNQTKANLSKMSSQQLFLSRVFHKTKIEVNEEGTVASAVTGGVLSNKATPQKFYVNRPFAFIILEKTTHSILFCGEVRSPSKF